MELGKCLCGGNLEQYIDDESSCACHINPPCSKCTDDRSVCMECGEIVRPEYNYKDIAYKVNAPIPASTFIDSGIDYSRKSSGAWFIVEGYAKKSMSAVDIKNKLGEFDKYHMFIMKSFGKHNFGKHEVMYFKASWCTD